MKKLPIIILILILIIGGLFVVRFIFGGPEDSWICDNGEWVKHGNPSAPKPTTECIKKVTYELYWGIGCPHCTNVDNFLSTWDKKDKVNITKLEVFQNQSNANKLIQRGNECKLDKSITGSVPLLYTPDGKCISGDTPIIEYFRAL